MNYLERGNFFGNTNRTIHLPGITLTDTVYTHRYVDWHYHENAYFTFILQGKLIEGNKQETHTCSNGSVLFHSWQEAHYNIKPEGYTRGFHIEFAKNCFADFSFDINQLQGSFSIADPDIKFLLYKAFQETGFSDDVAFASLQMLLFEIFGQMLKFNQGASERKPRWVKKIKEILTECYAAKISLLALSKELDLHPVHLSRDFRKHFDCTLSEYVRKIRVEKSLALLADEDLSLTEIAFACGFADQSHFLRCFKQINGVRPSNFRKLFHS